MNRNVKLFVLLVIFAVLVIVVIGLKKGQVKESSEIRRIETTKVFPDLEEDQVFRIELKTDRVQRESFVERESLIFQKNTGVWEVASGSSGSVDTSTSDTDPNFFRAAPEKVEGMIDQIIQLQHGELVTSDTTKQAQFDVSGQEDAVEVIFYDSQMNTLARILIGRMQSNKTFVRKPDEDEIYQSPGNLSSVFRTNLSTTRSRNLFMSSAETFTGVNVQNNATGLDFNLVKSPDGTWTGTDAEEAELELDPAKVDDLVSSLGNLSINDFILLTHVPVPVQDPPDTNIIGYWPESIPINSNLENLRRGTYQPGQSNPQELQDITDRNAVNITGDLSGSAADAFSFYESLPDWVTGDTQQTSFTTTLPQEPDAEEPEEIEVSVEIRSYSLESDTFKVKVFEMSNGTNTVTLTYSNESGTYRDLDLFGFLNPTALVEFTTSDGNDHNLMVGLLEGSTYYAALVDDLSDVYKISKSSIDSICVDPADLAPGEETEEIVDPSAMFGESEEISEMDIDIEAILREMENQ